MTGRPGYSSPFPGRWSRSGPRPVRAGRYPRRSARPAPPPSTSGTLHTTILVSATSSPGSYVVRDSNWNLDGKVSQHTMNPVAWAASRGVTAYFWRFGTLGNPDLWFIKTKNTGSGHVEVHDNCCGG